MELTISSLKYPSLYSVSRLRGAGKGGANRHAHKLQQQNHSFHILVVRELSMP